MLPRSHSRILPVCCLSLCSCSATLGGDDNSARTDERNSNSHSTDTNDPFGVLKEGCQLAKETLPPVLRRLTNAEFRTTIEQLFDVEATGFEFFQPDESTAGFAANWVSAVGDQHVEDYEKAAQIIAYRILETAPDYLRSCPEAETSPSDAECLTARIAHTAERTYRRDLEANELSALIQFHTAQIEQYGNEDADRMLLEVLFQSPQFLYLSPPYPGTEAETLASRLSYFLTAGPPDAHLKAQAASDELLDPDVLESQVDRLLTGDDFRKALTSFFTQWLDLERLEAVAKDVETYPNWSEELRHEMLRETELFIDHVLQKGGGLPDLLTSGTTIVSPALADLYGVTEQHDGTGWQKVELPTEERAGLLTQASFLAGHSHQIESSWALRGDFVRRHLLCDELPPPPDVDLSVVNDAGRLDDPGCANCHLLMDPIGQSFDRYDAVGRYSTTDADGAFVETQGELHSGPEPLDVKGTFESPLTLAETLSSSASVQMCMTRQMFRFAQRRLDVEDERCELVQIAVAFAEENGDLKSLMRSIALSSATTQKRTVPQ